MTKPKCYNCIHRRKLVGDAHSACNNVLADVTGNKHGIKNGWFQWPFNFDPIWLESCDGFSDDPNDTLPEQTTNPLFQIASIMKW